MARIRGKAKKAEIMTLEEAVKKYMHNGIRLPSAGLRGSTGTRWPLPGKR